MSNNIQFAVDNFSAQKNIYYLTGSCNSGSILLGSIFLQVYKNIMGKDAKGFPILEKKKFLRNIELKVKRIRSYNKDIDVLSQGMTGELWLEGKEGLQIQPREILTN